MTHPRNERRSPRSSPISAVRFPPLSYLSRYSWSPIAPHYCPPVHPHPCCRRRATPQETCPTVHFFYCIPNENLYNGHVHRNALKPICVRQRLPRTRSLALRTEARTVSYPVNPKPHTGKTTTLLTNTPVAWLSEPRLEPSAIPQPQPTPSPYWQNHNPVDQHTRSLALRAETRTVSYPPAPADPKPILAEPQPC